MDTLDFNLHQLILTELAQNISDSIEAGDPKEEVNEAIELITSKVVTRDVSDAQTNGTEAMPKVFMPASRINCNIAFGQFALTTPESHVDSTVTVLIGILRDVPHIDYERSLAWTDWSLPDELVFVTVCALLRLASLHPDYRERAIGAIVTFAEESVKMMGEEPAAEVIVHVSPAFHGLYRAVTATPFPWQLSEWLACSQALAGLFTTKLVERLNAIVEEFLKRAEEDPALSLYVQTFLARYKANERPLSGYFAVCSIVEIQWTALAQGLAPPQCLVGEDSQARKKKIASVALTDDAEAANIAWASLMKQKGVEIDISQRGAKEHLQRTVVSAMKCFNDLLVQVGDMEDDPDDDTYSWETMAESLKLATLCCVILGDLDSGLLSQLKLLLSDASPAYDNLLQEAALTSVTVLVHNFPEIASPMAHQLRKFITAPLPLFEFHFVNDPSAPTILAAAANCLALAPGDDFALSFIYSLLNYITATNQGSDLGFSPYIHNTDSSTVISTESGLRGKTESEKRFIGISTISVVTRLALVFKREDVTKLCISLLLQRLRSSHPTVQGAIAFNLVDLALAAPKNVFSDIIRVFSQINRTVEEQEPNLEARSSSNQVLAAQTRLAHELKSRPELYETYLMELLTMFVDKGTAIQTQATRNKNVTVSSDSLAELVALTLPIDALVSHTNFHPHHNAGSEVVAQFRNMWFICSLFRLSSDDKADIINEWQYAAMTRIAAKTPPVVLEEVADYLTNAIEYNPVFRNDFMQNGIARHRATLNNFIPTRGADIRYLTPTQIVFLLTMHDLETMRAKMFLPSSLVWYFLNEGINKNAPLISCMEAISEKVIRDFIADTLSRNIAQHSISPALSQELRKLLVASTHRIAQVRDIAMKYLQRLINAFPSLLCDPPFVVAILEVLTLMHHACEGEFTDEYTPQHDYRSSRADIKLELSDSYASRNEVLSQLYKHTNKWLEIATARAPVEIQATLQNYLADTKIVSPADSAELGASVALQFAKTLSPFEKKQVPGAQVYISDRARVLSSQIISKAYFGGEAGGVRLANRGGVEEIQLPPPTMAPFVEIKALKAKLAVSVAEIRERTSKLTVQDLRRLLFRCAAVLMALPKPDLDLLHYLVAVPFAAFTPATISTGIDAWTWLIGERKDMEISLMLEFNTAWASTIKLKKGIFSDKMDFADPFKHPVQYNPTDKTEMDQSLADARRLLVPHTILLQMLRSRFQAVRYRNPGLMQLLLRLVLRSTRKGVSLSTHPLARESRFSLLVFGFEVLRSSLMDTYPEARLREALYRGALSWFAVRPQWSFGANLVQVNTDIKLLNEFLEVIQQDSIRADHVTSSLQPERVASRNPAYNLGKHRAQNSLLKLLIENEISRLRVWANPTNDPKRGADYLSNSERSMTDDGWRNMVRTAWSIDAAIAVHMTERFKRPVVENELTRLVRANPSSALHVPEAVKFFIGDRFARNQKRDHKLLLAWDPVPPVIAVKLFEPQFDSDPIILQYAHRVLAQHPVDVTFFYVPQVVQALRADSYGYVERFIFETAKISQLFCHQIIWNMKANCYKDDAAEVEDPMKPMLDRMTDMVVASLTGEARDFYNKEFGFFHEVTSISGKLKPYIKKTKPEKKAKIDEEMAKIKVEVGCYLPSNPDGIVVDIDKRSGRPLQSHAKAPFMATFKVRKVRIEIETDPNSVLEGAGANIEVKKEYDVWQQAIFKVGDDCRQDVLALQIIAMFKNIFTSIGLMLYLYPYRVTATAPGCGVIDVVPNATSRDEMGRAKINDLSAFFISKYGTPDTIAFQKARLNFIQSMAAYSVACYILQIKDRHNGNIMIDGEGHIGVKFEPNSFKLNHEMVMLMGGRNSQGFNLFVQLTVKAFLAIRPHVTQLVDTVQLMLGTDFPSFKGEPTIKRLQDRFVPHLNERQAAEWMMGVIKNAHENMRSTVYDEFQRLQNGIPYA
ncbi:phosphatidylinositol-4- kinase [Ceratobasidium sp. 392]|nr:phosphatidylinositol-4- kinase [Ceratobasidium sp. 392]